jgi:membrane-bound metal-dependent hydrolase YbcI (DUF457 family)
MFLGHFGVALAAKKAAPAVSIGTTMFAAQFLDAIWPLLVLAGIERVEVKPGITRVTPLDFVYYPWSHSLAAALGWAALFAGVHWAFRRNARSAAWLAALVLSHWVLDWIVHRPDLPLFPGDTHAHGLGLWNSLPATLAIEFALFAAGILIYLTRTRARDRTGSVAFWALVAVLAVAYLGATLGPPPPSPEAVAYSCLVIYLVLPWGWWIDRHREPAPTP